MEYSEEPLQFINYHYFQTKDENHGEYQNVSTLIFALTQIPLFGMPFISCITVNFIYPKILFLVKQYQVHIANHYSFPLPSVNQLFYYTICKTSSLVTILLLISHVGSLIEFIDYGNEVLNDDDHNMPYVNAAFSGSAIAAMIVITYACFVYKAGQLQCYKNKDKLPEYRSFVMATLISMNILYILCYFCLYMLLAFLNDPLVSFSTYFIIMLANVSWFLFLFIGMLLFVLVITKLMIIKSKVARSLIAVLLMIICLIVGTLSVYAFGLLMIYLGVTVVVVLGNFSSSHLLQVLLLSFLIGMISAFLLKPAKKEVHNHAGLINSEDTSTEHGETHSSDLV